MNKTNLILQFIYNQMRGYKNNRSQSRRFRNYYMSNKDDTRGNGAKVIDYVASRIVSFFIIFTFIYIRYGLLFLSLLVTTISFSILHLISIRIRNKRLEQLKKQKRLFIASQKVYQEIMNKTVEELKAYFEEVFIKAGFQNLKHRSSNQKLIVYEGIYNDVKVLISLLIYKNDYEVELKELKEVFLELREEGITKGVMLTTSDFTKDCYQYIENIDNPYKILLLNRELMLKLIEKSNMLPSDEVIDELVENKISKREANWSKYKAAMLTNKKSKGYFLLSLFLFISAYYTPYPKYYYAIAGVSFSLTLITLALKYFYRKNPDEESWQAFNKMLKDL